MAWRTSKVQEQRMKFVVAASRKERSLQRRPRGRRWFSFILGCVSWAILKFSVME
jgi:hypothetical protein